MVDVSDGLLADLGHICRASAVGAEIWARDVPIGGACSEVASAAGIKGLDWALSGGEDYELLFTAASDDVNEIERWLSSETGTSCNVIGRITSAGDDIEIVFADGNRSFVPIERRGWNHFAP